ncbi:hypothetical protein, partial [Lactobacillus xujianguonis]|uniref:hypothetical protein n=2 Tax=Lactobacillaceae TaxID=33958 RepID=UPI00143D5AA1
LDYSGIVFNDKYRHVSHVVLDSQQTWAILSLLKKCTEVGSPQELLLKGMLVKEGTVKGIFFFIWRDKSIAGMIRLINDMNG